MTRRRRGKRKAPVRIAGPLGSALERAAPRGRRLLAVLERWRAMVSPETLVHARPTSIRRDVLYLTVTDSLWMSELTYFVPRFLESFNGVLPADQQLRSIRLRVGSLRPLAERPGAADPGPVPDRELPDEVRRRLARIPDPALRRQMERIAAKVGGTSDENGEP
jgi:hypothetical protein